MSVAPALERLRVGGLGWKGLVRSEITEGGGRGGEGGSRVKELQNAIGSVRGQQ